MKDVLQRIDDDLGAALERLTGLMAIPSVSTDPAYHDACDRAARHLADTLEGLGAAARVAPTAGRPMVVGHLGDGPPHLLFYGHYDVQPADPVEVWFRDPFDPAIEQTPGGRVIRGRGASDDKGQLMTFVEAVRAIVAERGRLPCRVTFLFEGEEESGSPSMVPFLTENADELRADIALVCDTGLVAPGVPAIVTRLRGMMGDEFTIHGPAMDLHSGMYGGPAINPLREISRIVASFHDETGRVAVGGFYEGVADPSDDERHAWAGTGFDEAAYLEGAGLTRAHGEAGYSALEQQWARPTLEVNGLWGGYQGAGSKTVIPAEAHCKITCRLVGDQDPAHVRRALRAHVEAQLAEGARVTWKDGDWGAPATIMDTARPEFQAARAALSEEWGREAAFVGSGGSIPIVGAFKNILGMDAILAGFAKEDDRIHSPNEKYDVESFHRGTRSWARILDRLAATA